MVLHSKYSNLDRLNIDLSVYVVWSSIRLALVHFFVTWLPAFVICNLFSLCNPVGLGIRGITLHLLLKCCIKCFAHTLQVSNYTEYSLRV